MSLVVTLKKNGRRNGLLLYWGIRSSPFGKLNLNCRWRPSSNNPLTSFFFFFLRDGKAIIRATANRKKETSAKEMSREILFLVLTAHYYVRRVSSRSSSSQSVSVLWRAKLLTFLTVMDFIVRCCWPLLSLPFSNFIWFQCRRRDFFKEIK